MRCYRCGNDHVEDSNICFKCGANLQNNNMNNNTNIANTDVANTVIIATSSNIDDEKCINNNVFSHLFDISSLINRKKAEVLDNKELFLERSLIYLSSYSRNALYTIVFFAVTFLIVLILKVKLLDFIIWIIPCIYYIRIALINSITGIIVGIKACILTKSSESMRCIIYNLLVNLVFVFYLFSIDNIVESFY